MNVKKVGVTAISIALLAAAAFAWHSYQANVAEVRLAVMAAPCRARAEGGDPRAQLELGSMYRKGQRVPKDYAEAVRWYRRAADQGNADAEYSLGNMYRKGQGVARDLAAAVDWYRRSADAGDAHAQYALGYMYRSGQGLQRNYVEAAGWYMKAAEHGEPSAQYALGTMYCKGEGVTQDSREGFSWVRKAADQGLVEAEYALGGAYRDGYGVAPDYAQAARWYRKAAEQGDQAASRALFGLYCAGDATPLFWLTGSAVVVLAAPVLFVPQRRWGQYRWLPWVLCSAICALITFGEVSLSAFSVPILAVGAIGAGSTAFAHGTVMAASVCGTALCAAAAVRATRGAKREKRGTS